jgi:DNA-binding response OmpR family regulator
VVSRLLLVEDDIDVRSTLARALRRDGHEVDEVSDGTVAIERGIAGEHDLMLLDLGLPGLDGIEVCRRVRAARPQLGILILTGRGGELDAVAGLDAGADDYVAKPFRLAELLARVRAHARRAPSEVIEAGPFRVDRAAHRAWNGDAELALSPKEFGLLELLTRHPGRTLTRAEIMNQVWGMAWFGSTKTLDMHVLALRRKLGEDAAAPRHLLTVRGVGFRFEA